LIMKIGPLPDAMKPDIHCVRTHWNRGFVASSRPGAQRR
jgi:hypothetical protein